MKALSVRQPWAWLIVNGYKDVENRDWPTNLRGRVYVHAGIQMDDYDGLWQASTTLREVKGIEILPTQWARIGWIRRGGIIGEVDIVDCVSRSASPWFVGRYGFVLANPVAYAEPIPYKGRLGFFDVVLPPAPAPIAPGAPDAARG